MVLELLRWHDCKDPRDKVYTALGMACDVTENNIEPNYKRSVVEVYKDVVRFVLAKAPGNRGLDFLGYVIRSAKDSSLIRAYDEKMPTCIPDWRTCIFPFAKVLDGTVLGAQKLYNASGDVPLEAYISDHQLIVKGLQVDSVSAVMNISHANSNDAQETGIEESWVPGDEDMSYPTGEKVNEVFNHVLVADVENRQLKAYRRGYAVDQSLLHCNHAELNDDELRRKMLTLTNLRGATCFRRLFWSTRGYMCLGPAGVAMGDKICVLFGGQVSYVLRERSNDQHEFVGECYAHGLMDGGALKLREDGTMKSETFTIV